MSIFDDPVTQALFDMSLDGGPDESAGDSSEGAGWAGLMIGVTADEFLEYGVPEDELPEESHFIIYEDTQGFHSFDSFATEEDAREHWDSVVSELEGEPEDGD